MGRKVLIADDDPALIESLRRRLESAGYEVIAARDSYQAVQFARQSWPDVLLLDINMPAGDGFTVSERAKGIVHLKGVPTVYLTGDTSERVTRLAEQAGAFAVLHKPYETGELLSVVAAAIDSTAAAPAE